MRKSCNLSTQKIMQTLHTKKSHNISTKNSCNISTQENHTIFKKNHATPLQKYQATSKQNMQPLHTKKSRNISTKQFRIRETKHLSTDADSSTDTIVGWTKITPKPFFLKNGKNHPKRKNSKMSRNIPKLAIRPLTRGL